jgi:chloride channel 3/4/5
MHITVSVVVIMFELTGALTYTLPTMIVVGVTKAVSELFGKGGIADRMIWFSGFPFLDNKEEHNFGVPAQAVMKTDVVAIPANGMTLQSVEDLLSQPKYQGFPIVEDLESKILLGYIGRTELRYAIDRLRRERGSMINAQAKCAFSPPAPALSSITPITPTFTISNPDFSMSSTSVDFSRYVDATPVTVHPRLPLETVMELFRKIGPRVILIEHYGRLTGLVTVKDCLKYQFHAEAAENPRDDHEIQRGHERLWGWIRTVAGWISGKVEVISGGRIQLGNSPGPVTSGRGRIMDGDEDLADLADDNGVELENR